MKTNGHADKKISKSEYRKNGNFVVADKEVFVFNENKTKQKLHSN